MHSRRDPVDIGMTAPGETANDGGYPMPGVALPERQRLWKRLGPWRVPVLASGVIVFVVFGQLAGTYLYGLSRVPASVAAQLSRYGSANIAVRLGFTPESFNLTYLSHQGNVAQTQGDTIYMSNVSTSAVHAIAGQYWVAGVAQWSGR